LHDPNLKPVKQRYETAFSLYQVSNGLAAEFSCDPERAFDDFNKARVEGTTSKYGGYFASAFRLKGPKAKSDAVTLLWKKVGKYWKVVAWDVSPKKPHPARRLIRGGVRPFAPSPAERVSATSSSVCRTRLCIHGSWPITLIPLQILFSDLHFVSTTFTGSACRHRLPPTMPLIFATQ
jgi:hypothetical protein